MAKFLLVDDDRAGQRLLAAFLAPYGECVTAASGGEAIEKFHQALRAGTPFDLVCLDILMPGMTGHEVLQIFRQLEHARGIHGLDGAKVVMITALSDSRHCIQAFQEGCESYIAKPIREEKLLAEVRSLLGSLEPAGSAHRGELPEAIAPQAKEQGKRFLIIDDDPIWQRWMAKVLKEHGQCDLAGSGKEGLAAFRRALENHSPYGVVCLDLVLPDVGGHQIVGSLRQIEREHGITGPNGAHVIMTTAVDEPKHRQFALRSGCLAYLVKPFSPAEFVQQMTELGLLEEVATDNVS